MKAFRQNQRRWILLELDLHQADDKFEGLNVRAAVTNIMIKIESKIIN